MSIRSIITTNFLSKYFDAQVAKGQSLQGIWIIRSQQYRNTRSTPIQFWIYYVNVSVLMFLKKVLKLKFKTEVQEMFCATLYLQISSISSQFFYHTQQTFKSTKHIFCSPVMHELVKVKNLTLPLLATVYLYSVQGAVVVCQCHVGNSFGPHLLSDLI